MSCNEPTLTNVLKHLNSSYTLQPNVSSVCEGECEEDKPSNLFDHVSKGKSKENFIAQKTNVVCTLPPNAEKHVNESTSHMVSSYDPSTEEFCEKTTFNNIKVTCSANSFNNKNKASDYFKKMTLHVIQCYGSKHWCFLQWRNSQKKPYIVTGCILCFLIMILLIGCCIVLLCLSSIIQNYLNSTTIQILSSALTSPKMSQFDFAFTTRVQRQTSLPFLLHTFKANVFYLPKNNMSSNSSVRSLQESFLSSNKSLYKPLAKTIIPEMFLNQKIQHIHPTTPSTIYIEDPILFALFLKELMQTGSAQWILQGYPSARFFFFHYKKLYFEKQLDIHGPTLISTTNHLSQYATRSTPLITSPKKKLTILSIDLTQSTEKQANLYVDILFLNDQSTLTINPLGVLYFNVFYKNQLLCFLTTNESVVLKPGQIILSFHGSMEPISHANNKQRYFILNEFFSFLLYGKTVAVQAVGVNSSIELFSPAIQSINISNELKLLESNPKKTILNTNDVKLKQSLIQSIETLNLNFKKTTQTMYPIIPVVGTFRIILANPFGAKNKNLIIKKLNLKGSLTWLQSFQNLNELNVSLPSFVKTSFIKKSTSSNRFIEICSVTGYQSYTNISPQSLKKSYQKLGAMPTDFQELFLTIEMLLNVSQTEKHFISFVRYLFEHTETTLQFSNVTVALVMTTPIGETFIEKLPLTSSFNVKGFSKMEGLNVNAVSIKLSQPNTTSSESFLSRLKSPLVNISVSLPATNQLFLYLGTLALSVSYQENHLVDLIAENCMLEPNTTSLVTFTGTVSKNTTTLGGLFSLYSKIQGKKFTQLKGTFIHVTNVNPQIKDTSPFWIRQALLGMTINITINRNQTHDMIEKPPVARIRDIIVSGIDRFFTNQNTQPSTLTQPSLKNTSTSTVTFPAIRHIRPGALLSNFFENLQHRDSISS